MQRNSDPGRSCLRPARAESSRIESIRVECSRTGLERAGRRLACFWACVARLVHSINLLAGDARIERASEGPKAQGGE